MSAEPTNVEATLIKEGMNTSEKINIVLGIIALVLLIAIWAQSNIFRTSYKLFYNKLKNNAKTISLLFAIIIGGQTSLFAADTKQSVPIISGFDNISWILVAIISLEVLLLILFAYWADKLLKLGLPEEAAPVAVAKETWWDKINSFKPIEQEGQIDTGHNYDGIRELDNITPPWFTFSFIATIIFAAIYMWRYHASDYGKTPHEEYKQEVAIAKKEIEMFLANQANQVDENNIPQLDASGIAQGKLLYEKQCAVCHLVDGGGQVGPNFTDNYWLHGGSLSDIYKVIKYGVVEKGMKSWQEDFSASQMVQLSNYIKSFGGTKPAAAKEPQGELYSEKNESPAGSTEKNVTDTSAVAK